MNDSPKEIQTKPESADRSMYIDQQRKHAEIPSHQLRGFIGNVIQRGKSLLRIGALGGTLFLAQAAYEDFTEQNVVHAQTLTEEQRTEITRLLSEGRTVYRNNDFAGARGLFVRAEEINRGVGIPIDVAISWNVCQVDARLAGFELFTSGTAAEDVRRINSSNAARLEAVLGFFTLAQIRPIRDHLLDAQTRLIAIRDEYDRQLRELSTLPAPANAREERERGARTTYLETELADTRRALAFVESTLQQINTRWVEIEHPTVAIVPPVDPIPALPPVVPTIPDPVIPSTSHTERPWALGLGVGGGGLAIMGISGITYFATSPQTVSDDQAITTASNVLFWTGLTATLAGASIIVFGEHPVEDRPSTTTVTAGMTPQPGGAIFSVSGTY